jgi:hypothetical protein
MNALTIHDILAVIPVNVTCGGADDTLSITVRVEYSHVPGNPAELMLRSAIMVDTEGPEPTDEQVTEWAQDWLDCRGHDAACNRAAERTLKA